MAKKTGAVLMNLGSPDSTEVSILIKRGLIKDTAYQNYASGEFTPGRGFDMVRTKGGTLNISIYAIARYLNQMPGHQTWQDHLGRDRDFVGRNDFFWHRTMIWFSGWLGTPKLTYVATVWTVFTTQQALIYGNIAYKFDKHFQVAIGVGPNISGLSRTQSQILTYAGLAAVILLIAMNMSKGQMVRLLATWCLLMLAIGTPVLLYISDDGPADVMKSKANAIQSKQEERLKQAQ